MAILSVRRNGVSHFYHHDGLGSTVQLTDANQNVTDEYVYRAFGEEQAVTGTTPNPLRFVGDENYHTDGQSGLVLLGVRYYSPLAARFLLQDGLREGTNWFTYLNSPFAYLDPTGLSPISVLGCDLSTKGTGTDCCYTFTVVVTATGQGSALKCEVHNTPACKKCAKTEVNGSVGKYCAVLHDWEKKEPSPFGSLICITNFAKWAENEAKKKHCPPGADKCWHCYPACLLAKKCGATATIYASWCNEMRNLTDCTSTAFEEADHKASLEGVDAFNKGKSCVAGCKQRGAF